MRVQYNKLKITQILIHKHEIKQKHRITCYAIKVLKWKELTPQITSAQKRGVHYASLSLDRPNASISHFGLSVIPLDHQSITTVD